jgi:hypothetical protein
MYVASIYEGKKADIQLLGDNETTFRDHRLNDFTCLYLLDGCCVHVITNSKVTLENRVSDLSRTEIN